ncbi:hypothetical protein VB711_17465 [Cronbergia sp. UHCC 0137]|uniref:hypothetical protein n=1 Tax=Cronbergia sp. UHCC 0137 TaxID=3110239 RepID=UPI002B21963D|nr:hypothetical protein [Cronbergia sp. UHCC 0137]MEA5619616.1 hypothetical protein [Cronbergia sp. UHCC 0137]
MINLWFRFWWYCLVITTFGVAIFGLTLIIFPDFMQSFFNGIFFHTSQVQTTFSEAANSYIKFVHGVLGAVMLGWSVIIFLVLLGSFRRVEGEAWWTITASIFIWLIVDSSFSISTGFWQNAVLNLIFFVCFIIPLAATYRDFFKANIQKINVKN